MNRLQPIFYRHDFDLEPIEPVTASAPTRFFQLFPGSNGVAELIFLCLLAPIYLLARLIKYLCVETHTPNLPHEWKESFREALEYAQKDSAQGLDFEELTSYYSLLEHVLHQIPEEVSYHPLVQLQLEEFRNIQESVERRLTVAYTDENGLNGPLLGNNMLALVLQNLGLLLNEEGIVNLEDDGEAQIEQLREEALRRQEALQNHSLTPSEKTASSLIGQKILPALFVLPPKELIEFTESLSTGDPALFSQFFPHLILSLWLKGDLECKSLTNVTPALATYVTPNRAIREKLSLLTWSPEARNSISFSQGENLFSETLAKVNTDALLLEMQNDLIDNKHSEKLKRGPLVTAEQKIALWDQIEGEYQTVRNCNPLLLYRLIDTDPTLKQHLQEQNALELLRSYEEKTGSISIISQVETRLQGKNLFNLLQEGLLGTGGYPATVGFMLGEEYGKVVSQAIAHAKLITCLQNKKNGELARFLDGINQTTSRFSQGNPAFFSLANEILKEEKLTQFNSDIDTFAENLKTTPHPSEATVTSFLQKFPGVNPNDPSNQNKLRILGWATLIKKETNLSENKLRLLLDILCEIDFSKEQELVTFLFLVLTTKNEKRDNELKLLALHLKMGSIPDLKELQTICKIDCSNEKTQRLLFAWAPTTLTRGFEAKFDEEIGKLKKTPNPTTLALEPLRLLLIELGLTNPTQNQRIIQMWAS